MFNLQTLAKGVLMFSKTHAPAVLAGLGAAGVIGTAVLAAKGHIKADTAVELWVADNPDENDKFRYPDLQERVKITWRFYAPAVVIGTLSIACIAYSQSINVRRQAAIMGLYTLSDTALKDFQEQVLEDLGPKKYQEVQEKTSQRLLDRNPLSGSEVYMTKGETLCFDSLSGRYFKGDIESVKKAQNEFNHQLINGTWSTLNDFYSLLGLKGIDLGDEVGWIPDRLLEVGFDAMISDDNSPCVVLVYPNGPKVNYYCE